MPNALTTGSTLVCGTGGVASLASTGKMFVQGNPVLRESDVSGFTIAGCKPKATGDKTCSKATGVTSGKSQKLFVGGSPALLENLAGTTDGTDATLKATSAGQAKLSTV